MASEQKQDDELSDVDDDDRPVDFANCSNTEFDSALEDSHLPQLEYETWQRKLERLRNSAAAKSPPSPQKEEWKRRVKAIKAKIKKVYPPEPKIAKRDMPLANCPNRHKPKGQYCSRRKKYCTCPVARTALPSYELPVSDDDDLQALLREPTNLGHWDAFRKRDYSDIRRTWSELLRVIPLLRLFVNHSGNAEYAELLRLLQEWVDGKPQMRYLSKYKNMGVEPSEFSEDIEARLTSLMSSESKSRKMFL